MSNLKLKCDATLDYQHEAVASIVGLFAGLPLADAAFSLTSQSSSQLSFSELGVSNPVVDDLAAFEASTLSNLRAVQERNGIRMSDVLDGMNFSTEMETGTGKTYVYLRTLFEQRSSHLPRPDSERPIHSSRPCGGALASTMQRCLTTSKPNSRTGSAVVRFGIS